MSATDGERKRLEKWKKGDDKRLNEKEMVGWKKAERERERGVKEDDEMNNEQGKGMTERRKNS